MLRYLIFFSALIFIFNSYSYSKDIQITADEFLIDKEENYFIARGNVVTHFQGYTIYSDNIYYDKKTELIYIDGKIKLLNDFLILGEDLKYDLNNKEGYITNGELLYLNSDKRKQKFITGKDIIVYDKNSYFISQGTFSSCEGEKKPWYLTGKDIKITLGEYLTAKNIILYAGNVPMLYTPFFLAPVKKEKESGFLFPYFGFSGKNGFIINLPYYFFLDESYDDTLSLRLRTQNTIGFDNEFRYKLSKGEEGIIYFSLYDNYDLKEEYAFLNFKHNKNNQLKVDLSLLNRRDFFYEYGNDYQSKSLPYLRSLAFYEMKSLRSLYTLNFFSGYNINLDERDFISFSITRMSYPVSLATNFYYNIDGSLSFFNRGDTNYQRLFLSPYGMYRYSYDKYDLFFKIYTDLVYYKKDLTTEQKRGYLVLNPDIQTLKTYLLNDIFFLRNSFKLSGIFPMKGFDNLYIKNDNIDFFNKSKHIELSFQQDALRQEDGQLLYNLKITQRYFIDNLYQTESFSDTSFLLRTFITNNTLGILGDYNHQRAEFTKLLIYNEYKVDSLSFNLNYTKQQDFTEFFNISLIKKATDTINMGLNSRYDIKDKLLKETGIIFDYLKNCYSIKIDLRNKKEPSEFLFFLYINLYGLGEIKFE